MTRSRLAAIVAAVALAVVAAAIVVYLGYLASWWLKADVKDREVAIANRNASTQTAWRDEVLEGIAQISVLDGTPGAGPAVAAITDTTCDLIGRLTDTYSNHPRIRQFDAQECNR